MKNYTKSDQVNIEAFKSLIKLVNNDILAVKCDSSSANSERAKRIFELYRQKSALIANAKKHYPDIDWITIAVGREPEHDKRQLVKVLVETKFNFN